MATIVIDPVPSNTKSFSKPKLKQSGRSSAARQGGNGSSRKGMMGERFAFRACRRVSLIVNFEQWRIQFNNIQCIFLSCTGNVLLQMHIAIPFTSHKLTVHLFIYCQSQPNIDNVIKYLKFTAPAQRDVHSPLAYEVSQTAVAKLFVGTRSEHL